MGERDGAAADAELNSPGARKIEDLIFDAGDGYRVRPQGQYGLQLLHRVDSQEAAMVPTLEILRPISTRTPGGTQRTELLLQAVCRFLNAGGTTSELETLAEQLRDRLPECMLPPGGWDLLAVLSEDAAHQIVFVQQPTGRVLSWVEDSYVEQTSLDDYLIALEQDDDD